MAAMKKDIQVSGHLEEIKGVFHMKITWVSADGKRQRKSRSTGLISRGNKKRAQDMLNDFIREKQSELSVNGDSGKDVLFTDYMKQWLAKMQPQIRKTTYSGYHDSVNKIIVPYFEPLGLKLSEVTPKHIQDFYTEQLERVKGTSVKRYHANIHKAFKDARKLQLIDSNPMDCVEPPKTTPYNGQAYTVDEVQQILQLIKGTVYEIRIVLMLFYGLRREEAMGLKWSNIDFDNDTLLIAHTITETRINGHLEMVFEDLTKNKSSRRSLPLVPQIKTLLLEKKQSISEYRKMFKSGYCTKYLDYVCVNELGDIIKPRTVSESFKRLTKQNNIRNLRLYDCRHTAASIMLKNGISMKQIQMILGHSDYSTTANIYSHLDYTDKISAANEMENIYFGGGQV